MITLSVYSQPQTSPEDLKAIVGNWEGSLTYIDYQTNKPFTMPANLIVEQGKNEYQIILKNIYPNESKANNKNKITIDKNGSSINKHKVTSREELEDGQTQIQTEHDGKDNNEKAIIRYTYVTGKDLFIIRKEVSFNQAKNWVKRSEFSYARK